MESQEKSKNNLKLLKRIGLLCVALSCIGFVVIYYPVISSELGYVFRPPKPNVEPVLENYQGENYIIAASRDFALVIPKIGVNVRIVKDVDPLNSIEYQKALSQGIAHARGSALPGEGKNTFLFAHSSDSFINANRYNSVFYLLSKMENGDVFYVVFEEKIYKYETITREVLDPENTELMSPDFGDNTVVLMTCWPAGTTLKRLVVVGKMLEF